MALEDKSLTELKACETQISREILEREEAVILGNGGFRCLGCGRAFARQHESQKHPGYCHQDGWNLENQAAATFFAALEGYGSAEIVALGFRRRSDELISVHPQMDTWYARLDHLILKIGGYYFELDYDSDGEETDVNLVCRGTKPPEKRGDYYVWPRKE